ncbi:Cysteine-rich receptor-like protein kinase 6 [Nymphaea thermarum]|nr:Cysteine-rich receptor-like protein kinase 6 [Nymphaea thermarum]
MAFRRADPMDGPTFDLAIIRSATNNFALENKLGKGGFRAVYWGELPHGQEIAVKRLSCNIGNGPKQFDNERRKRMQLDWAVRSKLINGIARGLLYLHEDSRLKIVSVKLDVFSFGVLLLEIISGKSNCSFNHQETDENLLNYSWRLWMENKALQVVDRTLVGTCDNEILRCIHIGLLCVQEDASGRPKMSKVVAMLENSSMILPSILPPAPSICKIRNISLGPQTSSTISGTGSEFGSST